MMQRLKGLINLKQTRNGFLSYQRNFSALPNYAPNDDPQDQVAQLKRLYESWEENPDIGFCLNEVKFEECKTYFQKLYKFVYLQATYLRPHVAILDGFSMGSGAGIAVAGMFRVATKTVFAHPEAQISFHPDAGASFYLSCLVT
uniref:3-hydroxyisobutyryl-CoA hydrolase n=1 Tax=Populus trichocarpa TaxID=3694 RepID=A0A3N7FAQ0_POPTR